MNTAHVQIRLANAIRPELSPVEVEAVTDDEQPYLLLPARLAARLGLKAVCARHITDENGHQRFCPYMGPLLVQLDDRLCYAGAVISGSEIRIGFTVLSALDPVTKIPTPFFRD